MSKSFLTPIKLASLSADPTGTAALIYYSSTSNTIRWYNGTTWASLGAGGGGGGGITYTYSGTAPTSPVAGDEWVDSNSGIKYTWVTDANSSQWAELTPAGTANGLTSAGVVYGDSGGFPASTSSGVAGQFLMSYGAIANGGPQFTTLSVIEPVAVATTTALVGTYANNTPGTTPSTFTITATGTLTIDGYTTALGDRILIKDQLVSSTPTNIANGVYVVTTAGATGVSAVLTRDNDADTIAKLSGSMLSVDRGTSNGGTNWLNTNLSTDTLGTTGINFNEMIDSASIQTMANKTISSSTISLSAGTSTVAPLVLASGTNLLSPSAGATEFDGISPYFTPNTTSGRSLLDTSLITSINQYNAPKLFTIATATPIFGAFVSTTGTLGTIPGGGSPWTVALTGMTSTGGFNVGQTITSTAGTGNFGAGNTVVVASITSATAITVTITGATTPTAGTVTNITTSNTGALPLAANTTYIIDAYINYAFGATTTRTISFGFGGTLTTNTPLSIYYSTINSANTAIGTTTATGAFNMYNTVAGGVLNATSTNAFGWIRVSGMVRTNLAATIIPQITVSAVPTGTPTFNSIGANSYFRLTPIGSGTAYNVGAWV
jgi:hypothetical protein